MGRSIALVEFGHIVAAAIEFLHEEDEVRDRTPAGQRAGAQFVDKIAKLAFCEVRIPRHHDELVKGGKRGHRRNRRFNDHGAADRSAPPG